MVNKVILIGNLGKDPEVRHLENGSVVAKMSVATNESYKDKSGTWQNLTEWHDVVMWRFLAERAERDLKKGSLVYVEGKLTHRKWQDKEGNDRYTTEVIANTFRLLEKRESTSGISSSFPSASDEYLSQTSKNAPAVTKPDQQMPHTTNVNTDSPADDDLPF